MLTLDLTHTMWDVIEFKAIVLVTTLALAVWLGNRLHKRKDKDE
jgi:hypothetical protein